MRRNRDTTGQLPAQQRLQIFDTTAHRRHLGLIVQRQLSGAQGVLQVLGQAMLSDQLVMQVLVKKANAATTFQLGPVLGHIGIADQFTRIATVVGKETYANTGRDATLMAIQSKRLLEQVVNLVDHLEHVFLTMQPREGEHELIAGNPGQQVGRAQRVA